MRKTILEQICLNSEKLELKNKSKEEIVNELYNLIKDLSSEDSHK